MDTKTKATLEKYYKELRENLIKEGALKDNSVFTSLMRKTSNPRKDVLLDSGLPSIRFQYDQISYLESQGFLQRIEGGLNDDKYVLTAKGIWYLDKENYDLSEDDLISFIQETDFEFESKVKSLSSNEKLVILSLIGIRCFSEVSVMDINNDKFEKNWVQVFEESYHFLVDNGTMKKKKSLLKERGRSSNVEWIMRRVNSLPKKTSYIYKYTGNKTYYLDLGDEDDESINEKKLQHLFELLFRDVKLNTSLIRATSDFCKELAYDKSRYVKKDSLFINSSIDKTIYDSLKKSLY